MQQVWKRVVACFDAVRPRADLASKVRGSISELYLAVKSQNGFATVREMKYT